MLEHLRDWTNTGHAVPLPTGAATTDEARVSVPLPQPVEQTDHADQFESTQSWLSAFGQSVMFVHSCQRTSFKPASAATVAQVLDNVLSDGC